MTATLLALPEAGWPRLAAATHRNEPLPSPLRHGCIVATISVAAVCIATALDPRSNLTRIVAHTFASFAIYFGAAVLVAAGPVASLARKRFAAQVDEESFLRFSVGAALPVLASGLFCLIPVSALAPLWGAACAALSVRSGWIGASALLGLEGQVRKRAGFAPGLITGITVVAGHFGRLALIP